MMPYKGIYWAVLSPAIERSLGERYSRELAENAVRAGKKEYKGLLERAPALGEGNPLAPVVYAVLVFAACWLGTGRLISPAGMGRVTEDVLKRFRWRLARRNLNRERDRRALEEELKKYISWARAQGEKYPAVWDLTLPEESCGDRVSFSFTRSPLCIFFRREGMGDFLRTVAAGEEQLFALQHGRLCRKTSLAAGDGRSEYEITGDRQDGSR